MPEKKRILIVEDDSNFADTLKFTLEKRGYNVVGVAGSSDEAVESVKKIKPNIVLMDIELKGEKTNGIETGLTMRENGYKVPILFLSGLDKSEILEYSQNTSQVSNSSYIYKLSDLNDFDVVLKHGLGKGYGNK
ncbi:MAG: response regulator [Candidatus Aenigmarchaeota archaeon]|nr:response regulator [Candidatus Aenigmarchaeota archaeon]